MPAATPTDTYIYLRGGRGDGFVPLWTGAVAEEGMVTEDGDAVGNEGKEVGEPYRDIFVVQPLTVSVSSGLGTTNAPSMTGLLLTAPTVTAATGVGNAGASVSGSDFTGTASDEVAHVKPRQFFKVCTWMAFTSANGLEYKFRKADVVGWGGQARI